jgi:hypothetical protein
MGWAPGTGTQTAPLPEKGWTEAVGHAIVHFYRPPGSKTLLLLVLGPPVERGALKWAGNGPVSWVQ